MMVENTISFLALVGHVCFWENHKRNCQAGKLPIAMLWPSASESSKPGAGVAAFNLSRLSTTPDLSGLNKTFLGLVERILPKTFLFLSSRHMGDHGISPSVTRSVPPLW